MPPDPVAAAGSEADALERLGNPARTIATRHAVQLREEGEILRRRQARVERLFLRSHVQHSPHGRHVVHDVLAIDPHVAAGRTDARRDHRERGRLPGPVRAEQAEYLALADLEGDPAHHLSAVVLPPQVTERHGGRDGAHLRERALRLPSP